MTTTSLGRRAVLAALPGTMLAGVAAGRERPWHFPVDRHGARGDGVTDDTVAIQRAIDACARAGGGVVQLSPGGRYLSGTIVLKDRVTLDIAGGATLLATTRREAYREKGCLIFAERAQDIAITGRGTIEGQGTSRAWFPTLVEGAYTVPDAFLGYWNPLDEFPGAFAPDGRPRLVILVACRRVLMTGFRIHDAPTWTVHPIGCEDLLIDGITIDNSLLVPNSDGIDIDRCRRVRVVNCAIRAGDDCVIVKTSRNFPAFGDSEEITIANCTLESSSAGLKIEPEGPGTLRSIVVSGCTISRSNRGIAVLQRDGAAIEDVLLSDLTITTRRHHPMWWGAAEAVNLSNLPRRASTPPGTIRSVRFQNLTCRGEGGLFVRGWPGSRTQDISFSGVELTLEKTSAYPADTYDIRPTEQTQGLYSAKIAAIHARDVADLGLRDVAVHWTGAMPAYYGAALRAEHVDGLLMNNVTGSAAHPGEEAISLSDVRPVRDILPTPRG